MEIKKRVAYFHNSSPLFNPYKSQDTIGKYMYSEDHPMKPKRIEMTHSLIEAY